MFPLLGHGAGPRSLSLLSHSHQLLAPLPYTLVQSHILAPSPPTNVVHSHILTSESPTHNLVLTTTHYTSLVPLPSQTLYIQEELVQQGDFQDLSSDGIHRNWPTNHH